VNTELGSESEVLEALKKIDAVEEAHRLHGVYDAVVKIRVDTVDKIKDVLTWQVRPINKIRAILTLITVQEKK